MASGSLSNSRSTAGIPLLSVLLRKNLTMARADGPDADRRLLFRDRVGAPSEVAIGSDDASIAAVSSPFTSFLQKLTLLQKVAVA
jgi:hypothetical protein